MQPFTLPDFFIAIATLILFWGVIMFFHKRGLKNEERKREADKREVNRLLDVEERDWFPDQII